MRKVEFEPYALGGEADIFAIKYSNEKEPEVERFLVMYKDDEMFEGDMQSILYTLEQLCLNGAKEYYFRREGKMKDRICAIPIVLSGTRRSVKNGTLRLYCIRVSDKLLILGGGGKKITRTYQEDSNLKIQVEALQLIDKQLIQLENLGVNLEKELFNLRLEI